jgi:hypothetical protein
MTRSQNVFHYNRLPMVIGDHRDNVSLSKFMRHDVRLGLMDAMPQ